LLIDTLILRDGFHSPLPQIPPAFASFAIAAMLPRLPFAASHFAYAITPRYFRRQAAPLRLDAAIAYCRLLLIAIPPIFASFHAIIARRRPFSAITPAPAPPLYAIDAVGFHYAFRFRH
jgi:hypothetical protein